MELSKYLIAFQLPKLYQFIRLKLSDIKFSQFLIVFQLPEIYQLIRVKISDSYSYYRARGHFPRLTFIRLHWAYFLITCLISSAIFYAASTRTHIQYVDSLFLVIAAMTQAGLNPVNLSSLSTFQQVIIFLLIVLGNQIFVSAFVIHVRKRAFKRRFEQKRRKREAEKRDVWNPLPVLPMPKSRC